MLDYWLNILTWFLILLGLSSVGVIVWFIIWTMTGELDD
jgi:hypothetical protein